MSEPVAYRDKNVLGGYYFAACKNKPSKDAEPLFPHPDPRVAELEAVLRECRDVILARAWGLPYNLDEAIAKIDEVLTK